MLFLNFKNYKSGLGQQGIKLVDAASEIVSKYSAEVLLSTNPTILSSCAKFQSGNLRIVSQHFDPITKEKSTGYLAVDSFTSLGITYFLLNHAEHKVDMAIIRESLSVFLANPMTERLILCFANEGELDNILDIFSTSAITNKSIYMAYEPANLIGNSYSTNSLSVLDLEKDNILKFKEKLSINNIKFMIGAGVKQETDFQRCYTEFKLDGILLSSIVMESADPISKLEEMIMHESKYSQT